MSALKEMPNGELVLDLPANEFEELAAQHLGDAYRPNSRAEVLPGSNRFPFKVIYAAQLVVPAFSKQWNPKKGPRPQIYQPRAVQQLKLDEVKRFLKKHMAALDVEHWVVACMDDLGRLVGLCEITIGQVDGLHAKLVDVFRAVFLLDDVAEFCDIHNHPSDDDEPSDIDIGTAEFMTRLSNTIRVKYIGGGIVAL